MDRHRRCFCEGPRHSGPSCSCIASEAALVMRLRNWCSRFAHAANHEVVHGHTADRTSTNIQTDTTAVLRVFKTQLHSSASHSRQSQMDVLPSLRIAGPHGHVHLAHPDADWCPPRSGARAVSTRNSLYADGRPILPSLASLRAVLVFHRRCDSRIVATAHRAAAVAVASLASESARARSARRLATGMAHSVCAQWSESARSVRGRRRIGGIQDFAARPG